MNANTRWPVRHAVTPGAVSITRPTTSAPGTKGSGGLTWYLPAIHRLIEKLRLAYSTVMRTPPGGSSGTGNSSTRKSW